MSTFAIEQGRQKSLEEIIIDITSYAARSGLRLNGLLLSETDFETLYQDLGQRVGRENEEAPICFALASACGFVKIFKESDT